MKHQPIGNGEMLEILLATGFHPYTEAGDIDGDQFLSAAWKLGYRAETKGKETGLVFYPDKNPLLHPTRYDWPGMLIISAAQALTRFVNNKESYLLYEDNTEAVAESALAIFDHAREGGAFGYEK